MKTVDWRWDSTVWTSSGLMNSNTLWETDIIVPLQPDQSLHRLVYRHSGQVWFAKAFDNPVPQPLGGGVFVTIFVGYGEQQGDVVYRQSHAFRYQNGWIQSDPLAGTIYWTGIFPFFEKDLSVRRARGVELAHSLFIHVREEMESYGENSHGANPDLPGSRLDSSLFYLTATPIPPALQ